MGWKFLVSVLVMTGLATVCGTAAAQDQAARLDFFEKKVRPLLASHCYTCHSADTKPSGGLRVDDRNGLLTGGNTGPAVVPGDPGKSLLLNRVTQEDTKRRMPKEGKPLTAEEVADLTAWIKDGAVWPPIAAARVVRQAEAEVRGAARRSTGPGSRSPTRKPPAVTDAAWPRDDVDRFILATLEAKGLKPVGDADRVALIRRVTFDLTGLAADARGDRRRS